MATTQTKLTTKSKVTLPLARRFEIYVNALKDRLGECRFFRLTPYDSSDAPLEWDPRVPQDFRDFATKLKGVTLDYRDADHPGRPLVAINLHAGAAAKGGYGSLQFDEIAVDGEEIAVDRFAPIDCPGDVEYGAHFAFEPEGTAIYFYNDDDDTQRFADLEAYVTAGARLGFVDGWAKKPKYHVEKHAELLKSEYGMMAKGSKSRETPLLELVEQLSQLDCVSSKEEAEQMVAWLGQDAAILLRDQTRAPKAEPASPTKKKTAARPAAATKRSRARR